jgi:hypothetical protein
MTTPDYVDSTIGTLHRLVRQIVDRRPELEGRAIAASSILMLGKVHPIGPDRYEVVGTEAEPYIVDQAAESCTCKDFEHRAPEVRGSKCCKHRIAAWLYVKLGSSRRRENSARLARLELVRRHTNRPQRPMRKAA